MEFFFFKKNGNWLLISPKLIVKGHLSKSQLPSVPDAVGCLIRLHTCSCTIIKQIFTERGPREGSNFTQHLRGRRSQV